MVNCSEGFFPFNIPAGDIPLGLGWELVLFVIRNRRINSSVPLSFRFKEGSFQFIHKFLSLANRFYMILWSRTQIVAETLVDTTVVIFGDLEGESTKTK